jgi:arsenate reductase (thioredoxin)
VDKKVLVLCTGNSCRSIIAEALINAKLEGVSADSSGVKANGEVNPNAKKLLEKKGIWKDEYHAKTLDSIIDNHYDLVVTVCDHAKESCPIAAGVMPLIEVLSEKGMLLGSALSFMMAVTALSLPEAMILKKYSICDL